MGERLVARAGIGVGCAVLLAVTTGCTSAHHAAARASAPAPTVGAVSRPSATEGSHFAAGCAVTTVRTDSLPAAVPGFTPGSTGSWMGGAHFVAYLLYAATKDPTMRAGGKMSAGFATKIFWWIPGGGDTLIIRGVEATTGRSFIQSVAGIGGGQFPSVPVVPGKGCWTLTESVGGRTVGAMTIPVTAALGT